MFLNIPNLEEFRLRYVLYYRHISFQLSTKAWSLLGPLIFIVNPFVLVTRPFSVVELRVQYVTTCCPRCKALFRRRAKRMPSPEAGPRVPKPLFRPPFLRHRAEGRSPHGCFLRGKDLFRRLSRLTELRLRQNIWKMRNWKKPILISSEFVS